MVAAGGCLLARIGAICAAIRVTEAEHDANDLPRPFGVECTYPEGPWSGMSGALYVVPPARRNRDNPYFCAVSATALIHFVAFPGLDGGPGKLCYPGVGPGGRIVLSADQRELAVPDQRNGRGDVWLGVVVHLIPRLHPGNGGASLPKRSSAVPGMTSKLSTDSRPSAHAAAGCRPAPPPRRRHPQPCRSGPSPQGTGSISSHVSGRSRPGPPACRRSPRPR